MICLNLISGKINEKKLSRSQESNNESVRDQPIISSEFESKNENEMESSTEVTSFKVQSKGFPIFFYFFHLFLCKSNLI